MKKLWQTLISLNTVFGLFVLSIGLCLLGSLMLPEYLEFFSGIDDSPLFGWLAGAGGFSLTWWIYALIGSLGLLALSTAACTADALAARSPRTLVHRLSPQLMHLGVLLVMLGHLLTAALGQRVDVRVAEGGRVELAPGLEAVLLDVRVNAGGPTNTSESITRWQAELGIFRDGLPMERATLEPAHPVRMDGVGLFFSTFNEGGRGGRGGAPSVTIRVCRDPGVGWALVGGIAVILGGVGFVWSRGYGSA